MGAGGTDMSLAMRFGMSRNARRVAVSILGEILQGVVWAAAAVLLGTAA